MSPGPRLYDDLCQTLEARKEKENDKVPDDEHENNEMIVEKNRNE